MQSCICVNAGILLPTWNLINAELINVNNWLNTNKLFFIASTSRAVLTPPKTRQQVPNLKITIHCEISVLGSAKYFGVYLDNKQIFGPHILVFYAILQ